jgi:hypothetical protein
MLFLVAKHLLPPQTVRYRGNVYALRTQPKQRIRFPSRHTAPPVPGVPEPDAADAIQEGVVPLSALPRTKWKHKMTHKDIEENGVIVKRQGLTVLEGELFWKGKFRQPPVTLEFTWEYTLDPKTGKYFLTHAELEDGSSHVLVDEHGKPTSLAGALFTIRHALGKNPTEPPPNLEQAQRFARYVKYDGHVYCRANAAQFIADIRTGKSSWPGVEIEVRPDDYSDDVAELANLRVKDLADRGKGTGSQVMQWITSLADAHDVTLRLHVEPFGEDAPPKPVIKRFYRGHGFRDRKQNWMERKPRTASVARTADTDGDYLYHVTYVNQLPSIGSGGLLPGAPTSFESGQAARSSGRVFWTEPSAIGFWMEKKGDVAENESDNPVQDGLIPIVLRTYEPEGELYDDEAGSQDAPDAAYYTEEPMPPSELELWNGHSWVPVAQANVDSLVKQAYDAADIEIVDGEELVYMDSEHFLP